MDLSINSRYFSKQRMMVYILNTSQAIYLEISFQEFAKTNNRNFDARLFFVLKNYNAYK